MDNPHSEERTRDVASPSGESDDEGRTQKISHVFHCMQCDLQFQADTVIVSREGSQEEEEQPVRLRLPEGISPTQRAVAEQMYEHIGGGGTRMTPLTQPLREEHKELLPHIERLRTVADSIGTAPIEWYSLSWWWIIRSTSANTLRAGFFVMGQSGQATSS